VAKSFDELVVGLAVVARGCHAETDYDRRGASPPLAALGYGTKSTGLELLVLSVSSASTISLSGSAIIQK